MKIDFDNVDDIQEFTPIPDGTYLCCVSEVEVTATQYGDAMWKLRFVVESGPHQGRYVFDNMVFSQAALKRVKFICSRLGLDISGEIDLTPDMIKGRRCLLTVGTEEYEDREGNTKRRNVVPFAGYDHSEPARPKPDPGEDDSEENLPF